MFPQTSLPPGWRSAVDQFGRIYYIDDVNKKTQWNHPNVSFPLHSSHDASFTSSFNTFAHPIHQNSFPNLTSSTVPNSAPNSFGYIPATYQNKNLNTSSAIKTPVQQFNPYHTDFSKQHYFSQVTPTINQPNSSSQINSSLTPQTTPTSLQLGLTPSSIPKQKTTQKHLIQKKQNQLQKKLLLSQQQIKKQFNQLFQ
ncbi:hypothetical protein QTN25_005835 [Entamoeba marina]